MEGLTKKWQKNLTGVQQWRCKSCKKYFQLAYKYTARKSGIKDKIIDMTLNNSGVRDIGRVLKISKDTVVAVLKKTQKVNPYFPAEGEKSASEKLEAVISCEGGPDEFWSFVQNKGNQRWTWYAIERKSGRILAWHNGKRQDRLFGFMEIAAAI
jgi:hypothetical protein